MTERENEQRRILEILDRSGSLTVRKLMGKLRLGREARSRIRSLLDELQRDGRIRRRGRLILPLGGARGARRSLLEGRMDRTLDGYGFVTPDRGGPDIHIPERHMGGAMNGDRVEVQLSRGRRGRSDRPAGTVVRILERADLRVPGRLRQVQGQWFLEPTDPRRSPPIRVEQPVEEVPEAGWLAVAEVERFSPAGAPGGRLERLLGREDDPEALEALLRIQHGLPTEFPEAVLQEARSAAQADLRLDSRLDLRDLAAFTVDPKDARDFDDALTIQPDRNGWLLGVHVADVSHYVLPGTALDQEARQRGCTVYLPREIVPMLPEVLSAGTCSLQPDQDRAAVSVLMEVDRRGQIQAARMARSVIRSRARLAYTEAQVVLEGGAVSPLPPEVLDALKQAPELLEALLLDRKRRGGLDLDLTEPRVVRDDQGRPLGVGGEGRLAAHRLIEEAMVAANTEVARRIARESAGIYRIHEPPDPDAIRELRNRAGLLGRPISLPPSPSPTDLAAVLAHLPDGSLGEVLRLQVLRSLRLARYDLDSGVGHYGLGLKTYTHFTSPIRRYPDLVVHRLLLGLLQEEPVPPQDLEELARLAEECSLAQRRADRAEGEALRMEAARGLVGELGTEQEGFVLDVLRSTLVIRFLDRPVEGLLPLEKLPGGSYRPDQHRVAAVTRGPGPRFTLGDRLQVRLEEVDVPTGRVLLDYSAGPFRD